MRLALKCGKATKVTLRVLGSASYIRGSLPRKAWFAAQEL